MGLNRISSNMVKTPYGGSSLKDVLQGTERLSVWSFGLDNTTSLGNYLTSINLGLSYIASRGFGVLVVPPIDTVTDYPVQFEYVQDAGELYHYRCTVWNYRYPINTESRPFGGGSWVVGDIINNTDVITNQMFGWICKESGTPGIWEPFAKFGAGFSLTDVGVTATKEELNFVKGVSSAIQTQLNSKAASNSVPIIESVTELPASPVATTWYFIQEVV